MIDKITQESLDKHAAWLRGEPDGERLVTVVGKVEIVANLSRANLREAKGAEYAAAITSILPDGDVVGWKKLCNGAIAKLLIPADAKRSNATGRKCRAEYAKVLEIWKDGKQVDTGASMRENDFIYRVGEIVRPTFPFDKNRWEECASGIHFFITRLEAETYEF